MEKVLITPEMAKYFLAMRWEHQRHISKPHVRFLSSQMEKGMFLPDSVITFVSLNGHRFLIDGQHRLSAVLESGVSVHQYVNHVRATTLDEVREIWTRYDVGKTRTLSQSVGAYAMSDRHNLNIRHINKMISALNQMSRGWGRSKKENRHGRLSHSEKVPVIEGWVPYMRKWADIGNNSKCEIRRHPHFVDVYYIGIGLIALMYQPERASRFFTSVASLSNLDETPAAKKMIYVLNSFSVTRHSVAKKVVTEGEYSSYIAKLWNSFYTDGRISTSIRTKDKSKITIMGTPFIDFNGCTFEDLALHPIVTL